MDRETALRELCGGSPELQQQAARHLGRWTDDVVLEALIGALKSPHRGIRQAAMDTLLEVGDGRTMRLAIPLLRSSVPAVRNTARVLLQRLAKADPESLAELSRDPDLRMRIFAANIMGESSDHEFAAPLLELLEDADENVRDAAVVGLGRLGAPEGVHRLEQAASQGTSWTRFSAVDALGHIRSQESAHALLRIFAEAPVEFVEPVMEALARQGFLESIGPIVQKLRGSRATQGVVVRALAEFPAGEVATRVAPYDRPRLADAILQVLGENSLTPDHSAAVLDLLGELGVRVECGIFVRLLSSAHLRVQQAAVRAASRLRLSETLPLLRQLAGQGNPLLEGDLQSAFAAFGEPRKERT